jgi:hypothetical protein
MARHTIGDTVDVAVTHVVGVEAWGESSLTVYSHLLEWRQVVRVPDGPGAAELPCGHCGESVTLTVQPLGWVRRRRRRLAAAAVGFGIAAVVGIGTLLAADLGLSVTEHPERFALALIAIPLLVSGCSFTIGQALEEDGVRVDKVSPELWGTRGDRAEHQVRVRNWFTSVRPNGV